MNCRIGSPFRGESERDAEMRTERHIFFVKNCAMNFGLYSRRKILRANYICCTMSSRAAMQAAFLLVCMASPASCFTQMTNQLQRCKLLASISTRPVCPGRCWRASLDSAGRGSRDRADDPYERLLRERSIGRAFTTKTWLSLPRVFVLLRAGTSGMKIRASHAHPPLPSSHSCWPHLSP